MPLPTSPITASFNPRAHAGRDEIDVLDSQWDECFNPRAHAGRDAARVRVQMYFSQFQSTRPRGARRDDCGGAFVVQCVSIHAPTRGAT